MRERVSLPGDGVGALALGTVGGLCLLVAAVGAVAVGAELLNTWGHYFLMERVIALATPVTLGLLGAALLAGLVLVARA